MDQSSSLVITLLKEPRTRVAIATAAASAPLVWGGLAWVSTLSFLGQLIVGMIMGVASVASFYFLSVHRKQTRMHKAVTVAQFSCIDPPVLKRLLPVASLASWIQHATDFEKATWINRELDEVWPYLDQAASEMLVMQLQPVLDQYKFGPINSIKIKSITLGKNAPLLGGFRFTAAGKSEAMLEIEVDWRHGRDQKVVLDVQTTGPDFSLQIKDFVFYGVLRVIFKPLTDQLPCFGAAVVSLKEPPTIDFATKFLGGDVLQLPGLDSLIDEIVKSAVMDMLVWPCRMVFPILPGDYSFLEMKPVAYIEVNIIEAKGLLNKEWLGKSDPFVYVYVRHKPELMQRTATRSNTSNPTWNEHFIVDVEDQETQKLQLRIMDSDKLDAADFLGYSEIPIKELEPNVAKDMWLKLIKDPRQPEGDKSRGELHVVVTLKPYKKLEKNDGEKELLPPVPEGAGVAPPTEPKKNDNETTKKDVSTPAAVESGSTGDATLKPVEEQGGQDESTAFGSVNKDTATSVQNNSSLPANIPQEGDKPPASSTSTEESQKSQKDAEMEAMTKFIGDQVSS